MPFVFYNYSVTQIEWDEVEECMLGKGLVQD